jgi:CRISPR/Cas system-associated exonuclease Cas4 (RecB family)
MTHRERFIQLENHWATVRVGYIRDMPQAVRDEIEVIYRAEIEPNWIPNKYCKGCYFEAIERLIKFYDI